MSQPERDRVMERMATDADFARSVRADAGAALAGYDLTDAERQGLASLETEARSASTAQPRELATRRSKSSMIGIGAVAAVAAAGAATFGYVRLQPPTYARFMSIDSGPRDAITTVSTGTGEVVDQVRARGLPARGPVAETRISITKPVDSLTPGLRSDIATGRHIASLTVVVQRNGSDWLVYQATDVIGTGQRLAGAGNYSAPSETDDFAAATISVSYPNGP